MAKLFASSLLFSSSPLFADQPLFTPAGFTPIADLYGAFIGDSTHGQGFTLYSGSPAAAFETEAANYFTGTVDAIDLAESGSYFSRLCTVAAGAGVTKAWVNDTAPTLINNNQLQGFVNYNATPVTIAPFSLGVNDHYFVVGQSLTANRIEEITVYIAAAVNAKNAKMMLNTRGRAVDGDDAGMNLVMRGQLQALNNSPYIVRGIDRYATPYIDAKHPTQAGYISDFELMAIRAAYIVGNDTGGITGLGAAVTSAVLKTDEIELTLEHQNGTDITPPTAGNGGIDANDDGVQMGSTALTRVNATTMKLTFPQGKAPVFGSVVEVFVPYGANGTGLNQAAPDVARDNSALTLPIQSDIIVATNGDPIQAIAGVIIDVDARGSVKTLTSGTELDSIAKINGSLSAITQVADGDHATWDSSGYGGRGSIKFRSETDLLYGPFAASGTHGFISLYKNPATMAGVNSNRFAFSNSGGATDTQARLTDAANNACYWASNEAGASAQVTPIFTGGETYFMHQQFVNTSECNVYLYVVGSGIYNNWTTPAFTFDPRNISDYESQTYCTLGGRSTAEDATLNLEISRHVHFSSVLSLAQREEILAYLIEIYT